MAFAEYAAAAAAVADRDYELGVGSDSCRRRQNYPKTRRFESTRAWTDVLDFESTSLSVLAQAAPYLRSYKRRRAQVVLERYLILTPRNGKYSDAASGALDAFEHAFLQIQAR
jgi:hypothetical protein